MVSEHTGPCSLLCTDPYPLLKAPIMGNQASQLDNIVMEEGSLVCWIMFSYTSCGRLGVFMSLPEEETGAGCAMGRRRTVMLWAMFCWETLGVAILLDECSTCLNIVADQVHPFMETVFPTVSRLFHSDNASCHTAKKNDSGTVLPSAHLHMHHARWCWAVLRA